MIEEASENDHKSIEILQNFTKDLKNELFKISDNQPDNDDLS
jgi:hypothetical protein